MEALVYIPEHKVLITAVEGTGDNLLDEDIEEGYVDYAMTTIYKREGEDIEVLDSGQIMFKKLVKDMTFDEFIKQVVGYHYTKQEAYILLDKDNPYEKGE